MQDDPIHPDTGLTALLDTCLDRTIDHVRQRAEKLAELHQAEDDLQDAMRLTDEKVKYRRLCEAHLIRQMSADIPAIQLQAENNHADLPPPQPSAAVAGFSPPPRASS